MSETNPSETLWQCIACGHLNARTNICAKCGAHWLPEEGAQGTMPTAVARVSFDDIARVLTLISARPNERNTPRPEDAIGDFDGWFDGGAFRAVTGYTDYLFVDGTHARVATLPYLNLALKMPNGASIMLSQS